MSLTWQRHSILFKKKNQNTSLSHDVLCIIANYIKISTYFVLSVGKSLTKPSKETQRSSSSYIMFKSRQKKNINDTLSCSSFAAMRAVTSFQRTLPTKCVFQIKMLLRSSPENQVYISRQLAEVASSVCDDRECQVISSLRLKHQQTLF